MLFFRSKIRTAILRDVYLVSCINKAYGSTYYGRRNWNLLFRFIDDLMCNTRIYL